MLPPQSSAATQYFQRQVQHVQQFIQSQLHAEDPDILSLSSSQVQEYHEEIQHYVQQKQRTATPPQIRPATAAHAMKVTTANANTVRHGSIRSVHPAARQVGTMPQLATHTTQQPVGHNGMPTCQILPAMDDMRIRTARHPRILKKQMSM